MQASLEYRKWISGYSRMGIRASKEGRVKRGMRKLWGMVDVFVFLIVKMLLSTYTCLTHLIVHFKCAIYCKSIVP